MVYSFITGSFFMRDMKREEGLFAKPMSAAEEQACLTRLAAGDPKAREELIERNMRLVAHIVRKYAATVTSWEPDDLISVGAIGLIKGIDTYDMNKKSKVKYVSGALHRK